MNGCGCGSIKLHLWILLLEILSFHVLAYTSFLRSLKNVNSILSLGAIQMQVLSWICPVGYCLPIPGGGVSSGNDSSSNGGVVMVMVG